MKPGRSTRTSTVFLPEASSSRVGLGERGVRAVAAAMDLDERDDVRGVEVVDADEVVRAGQPLGKRVHGEAAGVAADDQLRVGRPAGAREGPSWAPAVPGWPR